MSEAILLSILCTCVYGMFIHVPIATKSVLYNKIDPGLPTVYDEGLHFNSTAFLPDRWQLINVPVDMQNVQVKYQAPLPLTRYLQLPPTFEVQISLSVQYSLIAEQLPALLSRVELQPAQIDSVFKNAIQRCIQQFYLEQFKQPSDLQTLQQNFESFFSNENGEAEFSRAAQKFMKINGNPVFKIEDFQVQEILIPEYEPYRQVIRNSERYFEAIRQATLKKIAADAETYKDKLVDKQQLEKMKKLSSILQANPSMADIIRIELLSAKTKVFYYMDRQQGATAPSKPTLPPSSPVLDIPEIYIPEEGQLQELSR